MSTKMTVAALLQRAYDKPGISIGIRVLVAKNPGERKACVEEAVGFAIEQLVENRQLKQDLSEDQLSSEIIGNLRAMGIPTTHDEQIGGHVDIAVRLKGLLWLAEAKKWKGNAWAHSGMKQLLTRYSTGLPGQQHGGLILYFYQRNVKERMSEWKEFVEGSMIDASTNSISDLAFTSDHCHVSAGTTFSVRHFSAPLFWEPNDR